MKRVVLSSSFIVFITTLAWSQNLQLNYNLGKYNNGIEHEKIGYLTTTLEMFRPDTLGYTFFFVDMDYSAPNGMYAAYGEIVRGLVIPKVNFMKLEISYNGGTGIPKNTWLIGPAFPIVIGKSFISVSTYYRAEMDQETPNAQITTVWTVPMLKGKLKFTGFFDVWTRDNFNEGNVGKMFTYLCEPQLWFCINKHFEVGSETEFSYNFFTFDKKLTANSTVAVKWTF